MSPGRGAVRQWLGDPVFALAGCVVLAVVLAPVAGQWLWTTLAAVVAAIGLSGST
jgi:hypothetical protein